MADIVKMCLRNSWCGNCVSQFDRGYSFLRFSTSTIESEEPTWNRDLGPPAHFFLLNVVPLVLPPIEDSHETNGRIIENGRRIMVIGRWNQL